MTETLRKRIRDNVIQEAGQDQINAAEYAARDTLKHCVQDWKGFFDVAGNVIPFSQNIILELIKIDPEIFSIIHTRILSVARFGELDDLKN